MRGDLKDAMIGELELESNVALGELNDEPRHHMGPPDPDPPSDQYGFAGFANWDGESTLELGYEGYPDLGDFGRTPGWLKRARKRRKKRRARRKARWKRIRSRARARNKRIWRRHVARRRAWCKKHKKFCKWWAKNWAKVARIINIIGGAIATCIPFVGAILGPAMAASTEAIIRAGEKSQKCMKKKKKKCWKEGLKAFGQGMAQAALDTATSIGTKYGSSIKLTPQMEKAYKKIVSSPAFKKLKGLYEKLDKTTGSAREKIMDQIGKIDDELLPQLHDLEEELDSIWWDKAGYKREWKEDEATIREDKKGDKWGMWDPDAKTIPEGVTPGIWIRLSGKSAVQEAEAKMGDTEVAERAAAGGVASKASSLEKSKGIPAHKTVTTAAGRKKRPPLKLPKPKKMTTAQRAAYLKKLKTRTRAKIGAKPLYKVGPTVIAARTSGEAKSKLVQAAAEGTMSEKTAEEMGFFARHGAKVGLGVAAVGTVALIAFLVTRKRR